MPCKIDLRTIKIEQMIYARVLVEVDLSKPFSERVLVTRKMHNVEFFVDVMYERLPTFCLGCNMIKHDVNNCRKNSGHNQLNGQGKANKEVQ